MEAVQLALLAIDLIGKGAETLATIRASATATDRATIDAAYDAMTAKSNEAADVLRRTPPDT
jgi:hypothetical protein